jgi:putative transcription factor
LGRELNCDICGREIIGQAFKVTVEGAKVLVCDHCQTLGKPYKEDHPVPNRPRPPVSPRSNLRSPITLPVRRKTAELPRELDELDLADDFAERVRKHRTKLGISQEELARRVKQKLSVIQKIETGKITPDSRLCHELEHELKVKLLLPRDEEELPKATAPTSVTLGDIIQIKDKSKPDDANSSS